MIRYGPAGIPLSCKGRTLKDGIEDVHDLALTALEIQMVRPRTYYSTPDEEVGKTIRELDGDSGFVMGIEREGEDDTIFDPDTEIEEEDNLLCMGSGPADCFSDLYKLGNMARRHDVKLSIHTPYYMDLGADITNEDDPGAATSMQYFETIRQSGVILNALGGDMVVTNLGPYDERNRSREDTENNMASNLEMITEWWKAMGLTPRLGIEVTGHQDVFGSLEQILDLCDNVKGLTPVLNFPHYQSRNKGSLVTPTDFVDLINQFLPYCKKDSVYSSFSNVEYTPEGNEKYLTPIKKGDLKYERLAEALADMNPDITIISSSPLLEHDAVYMRTLTERVLSKKAAKYLKDKKKEEDSKKDGESETPEPENTEEE